MQHEIYAVTSVEVVGDYKLRLIFDDGKEQTINFQPVLEGELFGPLKDPALFAQVRIDEVARTIIWPNGADFDPATLHDWNIYESDLVAGANRRLHAAESSTSYTIAK